MTDTLPTRPPGTIEPGTVRRSRIPLDPIEEPYPMPVTCRKCQHVTHYHACEVRLPWYWRFFLRREFCCCIYPLSE